MYEIIFYHSRNGESEIEKYLDDLHFIKKSRKTPIREIEQARWKLKDFLERSDEQ